MKKFALYACLVIFAILAGLISCNNSDQESNTGLSSEDSMKIKLARGNYLVHSVVNCVDCHSKLDLNKFSMPVIPGSEGGGGLAVHDLMEIPGKIYVPNITPAGLKDWTDEEIARAMTRGINKKGDTLFPMMPYHGLSRMAREDVGAVIAYLRTLTPIENKFPDRQMFVPAAVFGPIPDNDYKTNTIPDSTDQLKYGEYLLTIAHCTDCHTPMTDKQMPDMDKFLAGGQSFKLPTFAVTVANITPDSSTGIGTWTEKAFVEKFKNNSRPDVLDKNPGKFNTIMPWSFYGTMKENDLKAIYAYLRTIKPVSNKIVKWEE